ncbi:MAG: NAD(P)-dependent oxidoreductase [Fimbriimonadaceae bacterium]|nr:NAD(P)-dependent oxidoreductase [Fimbriimonadaceae bacterium]QYK55751.1 MAG: NAD(P)-dependent oxidoreductase [Fimbriimonadaceae bacterium]
MQPVGFIGLGVMGGPMAGHLLSAGWPVTVWARRPESARPLEAQGARVAPDPASLAREVETVVLCVNRSEDVHSLLDSLLPALPPRFLVVDHSTIAPAAAREAHARCSQSGGAFLDAPVTGGSMGAQKGTLTVMCGGEPDVFNRAKPVMEPYSARIERVGGPGAGQTTKAANQIAVAGSLIGLCEALAFARKSGLDLETTRALLASGAAGSWAMDNYGPKVVERDWSPGFSIKNQRKDFEYVVNTAQETEAAVPATQLVDALLAKLDEAGHGEWATAALFEALLGMGFEK